MKVGKGTIISPKASIFNGENIEIGENCRIDDYCILSGGAGLKMGSHIHVGAHTSMYGGSGIEIGDYSSFGVFNLLHSDSDNFDGTAYVGPVYPDEFRPGMKKKKIVLERFVNFGARITVLPGCRLREGSAVGAHSCVMTDLEPWTIYIGIPAKPLRPRSQYIKYREEEFLDWWRKQRDDQ